MTRFLGLSLLFLFFCAQQAVAQQGSTCAQTLRLARSTYDQGRLHELPEMMKSCLENTADHNGFTKQERVEAYRILTLAFIYLEEPAEADKTMLLLLQTDHFYRPNPDVDPAEFQALYKKFRNWPIFRIAIKGGVNYTMASTKSATPVGAASAGNGSYVPSIGFHATVAFEKDVFGQSKNAILKRLSIAPEVAIGSRAFRYENSGLQQADVDGALLQQVESTYNQTWFDVNGIIQFKLKKEESIWNSYVLLGGGANLLLAAKNPTQTSSPKSTVTGTDVETKTNYKPMIQSLVTGLGVKRRVGEIFVVGEVRYQYGLTNPIDPAKRTNLELQLDYGISHNNFSQSSLMINLGVTIPKFKPKKLYN